jgi:predicted NBD/HSP70 family sugar kinase
MMPKYIGLDVHQATISAAVLDSSGKLELGWSARGVAGHIAG